MASGVPVGVLLAVTGDDAPLVRALDAPGTGLRVVRRCGDLTELLSAGMAGLAGLVVLDTSLDDVDRTVVDRLVRAGMTGVLLAPGQERDRWASAGWPVLDASAPASAVLARLQDLARPRRAGAAESDAESAGGGRSSAAGDRESAAGDRTSVEGDRTGRSTAAAEPPDDEQARRDGGTVTDSRPSRVGQRSQGSPQRAVEPETLGSDIEGSSKEPTDTSAEESVDEPAGGGAGGGGAGTRPRTEPGSLIVVWGPHGAPGRTTVAAALAHGLARAGGSLLVDADVEAPGMVQVLGLPDDSSGLATAARLAAHGRLDDEALDRLVVSVSEGAELLSGLGRAGRWREVPPVAMREVWDLARRRAAWTVVDVAGGAVDDAVDEFTLEPGRGAVTADLLRTADVVVVVGAGDPVGVRRLLQLLGDVDDEQRPAGRVEVAVNRVRASVAGPSPAQAVKETLGRFGGINDVVVLPEDGVAADRCLLDGVSVLEGAADSDLGRALAALVDRIDPSAGAASAARRRRRGFLRRGVRT